MIEPHGETEGALSSGQLQDRAVRGAAWTMVHTVISLPLAFCVNLLLARVLAPEGYGRLAFLSTVIAIAGGIIAMGLSEAMIQFGAKAHAAGRTDEVKRILSSAQGFRLIVVAPILTLLVLLLIDVPLGLLLLAVAFGVLVPAALDGGPIALFIENKTASGAQIAMVSNFIVQVGVVIAVLWLGTADAVWAARIVLAAIGIGLAFLFVTPAYRRAVVRPRLPVHFPPGFWRFAIPTGLAGLVGQLALSRTEVLYLTWWSSPESVGLFALALGVAGHIFAPAQALTGPLTPAISGLREVDPHRVEAALFRTLRASATIIALLMAAALPALVVLIPTLYGDEFRRAAPAVLVLGLVGGTVAAVGPVTAFVLARLSGKTILRANIVALVVNFAAAVALIPTFGMWGAVISNGSASLVQMGVLLRNEQRDLGLESVKAVQPLLPVLLGAVACTIGWVLTLALGHHVLIEAGGASLIALIVLGTALRLSGTGMDPGDADAIVRVMPSRLHRPIRLFFRVLSPG